MARVIKPLKENVVLPSAPRHSDYRVPVTDALRGHIVNLRNGQTWRALRDELPGWKWSHSLLADIVSGKVASTSLAVYEALGVMPPFLIIAAPGSIIVGTGQGLLCPDQPVVYIAIPPDEWQRHSMLCAACGSITTRWHPAQRYCNAECRKLALRLRSGQARAERMKAAI